MPKSNIASEHNRRELALGGGHRVAYPAPTQLATSEVMRGNKKRDTRPELAVRRVLHSLGYRYRVNKRIEIGDLRVRPDIVVHRAKLAVFIDGCFWHGCRWHGTRPRTNASYWSLKIARNIERDRAYDNALRQAKWTVIRGWEHEDPAKVAARIAKAIELTRRPAFAGSAGRKSVHASLSPNTSRRT